MKTAIEKAREKLEAKGIVPKTKVKIKEKKLKEKNCEGFKLCRIK